MTKKLAFWIVHEVAGHEAVGGDRIRLMMDCLTEFETAGDAMRYRDRNGRIAWKPTRQMLERLADQRREAVDDLDDTI